MTATQVSKSQCIEIGSNPGYYLIQDAAYAWDRAVAAFGKLVLITGAWRSLDTQVQIFDSELYPKTGRYVRGNRAGQPGYTTDVRGRTADGGLYRGSWWTRKDGTAAAAVPGTSNHGGGVAVDVQTSRRPGDPPYAEAVIFGSWSDVDRTRFLRVAAEHGWADDEGRSVGELWHLTYYPERDKHRGVKPTIQQEEPDLNTVQATQLSETTANTKELLELLGDLIEVIGGRVADIGTEAGLTHDTALERVLILARRNEARDIAEAAAPAAIADIDAEAVADALVVRLPKPIIEGLVTTLTARLAK